MTIGSDQLDAWGRTLIEVDELYREIQLLVRINPEGYTVDHDALAMIGVANADGDEDEGLLHPLVFAKRWAWHLAAANKAIPPITNAWVPLIRYVSAHLQYLDGDDRDTFATELRKMRGTLGAMVNENGLSQGEQEDMQRINARQAREELRERVTQINQPLTREELHIIWPELTETHWLRLRARKQERPEGLGYGTYWPSWVADMALSGDPDLILGNYASSEYVDVYGDRTNLLSLQELIDSEEGKEPTGFLP